MKVLQQYRIPFTGLKPGKHQFDFDVDQRFFDEFEYSIVKNGNLSVQVELDKQETMIIATFLITGNILLTCDVCLGSFEAETIIQERLIFKFSDDDDLVNDTEEIVVVPKNAVELDLANPIYEYINLAVPFYNRCSEQGKNAVCDENMINRLNHLSVADREENNSQTDPRWDALKNIKKQ